MIVEKTQTSNDLRINLLVANQSVCLGDLAVQEETTQSSGGLQKDWISEAQRWWLLDILQPVHYERSHWDLQSCIAAGHERPQKKLKMAP